MSQAKFTSWTEVMDDGTVIIRNSDRRAIANTNLPINPLTFPDRRRAKE